METEVEVRCPLGPKRLFLKLLLSGEHPESANNVLELACDDCKRTMRKSGRQVFRVLHRYNSATGVLLETVVS